MKEKILASLKTKYKNLGVSDKALEGIAAMLAVTTTDEANIETATDGVKDLLTSIQSDADKRVTDAVAKIKPPKAPEPPKTPADEPPKTDETPAWAKSLISEIAELKAGKTVDLRKQTLETKLKDVNPAYSAKILKDFQRMKFESDEDFNAYVAETETDAVAFTKENVAAFGKPTVGTPAASSTAIDSDIKEWAAKNQPITN